MPKAKKQDTTEKNVKPVDSEAKVTGSELLVSDTAVDNLIDNMATATDNSKTHKTLTISATSKISCELNDVWYSFSFSEIRQILDDSNMAKERQDLWDAVNLEVDNQVQDVIQMLKHPGATT